MIRKKIYKPSELKRQVQDLKRQGKKIVTVNGSFDLLHLGHMKFLEESKKQGDVLVVLVNSDSSIRVYKGPNRPICDQQTRMRMLAKLESVDFLTWFNEINPKFFLAEIKPDVHCNGSEWGRYCVEHEVVERYGGRIKIIKMSGNYSTSSLLERIMNYRRPVRAVFLDLNGVGNDTRVLKKISKAGFKIIIRPDNNSFLKIARNLRISLVQSWYVCDKDIDVVAGREANIKTIKLGAKMNKKLKLEPNFYARNLAVAVNTILKK